MIKAVIFDCFGVFTEDGWLAFCRQYGTDDIAEELRYINHQADRGRVSYEDFLDTVCKLTGASRGVAHEMITTNHHPNTALFTYAQELKAAGYKLGMISNVGSELNNFLPQEYVDLFDAVTLSYHVGVIKPDAVIYLKHLAELELPAEACVFIDDREVNVVGAQAVGMQAVAYTNIEQVKTDLVALGVE
ncbi:MAG: HAD family phosphatase [Candidatus Saccharimonadales bacterium]